VTHEYIRKLEKIEKYIQTTRETRTTGAHLQDTASVELSQSQILVRHNNADTINEAGEQYPMIGNSGLPREEQDAEEIFN
jgi:hypothetical protein